MPSSNATLISPLAIAPMIDWTYSHFRVFMRLLLPKALLYTEMQTLGAIFHNPQRSLFFEQLENPLALQLGGHDSQGLAKAAKMAEGLGFAEVNLNLGCPSDRVKAGRFGACLMAEPKQVADCIKAMKDSSSLPISAKTRIGIDEQDSYEFFADFAGQLIAAGCDKLIVHARKAWLNGLSPKQNRTIPPLHYDYAYRIKAAFPELPIVLNGNLAVDEPKQYLGQLDGLMFGRLAYQNPYALVSLHRYFYPELTVKTRYAVFADYLNYCEQAFAKQVPLSLLLKPVFNLAFGLAGAKQWKEALSISLQAKSTASLQEALDLLGSLEAESNPVKHGILP